MAEAVDRLELVADEEDLLARDEVDELALEPVRVLELVHENRAEAPARVVADLLVQLQEVARLELKILEVEGGLARLRLAVRRVEGAEQLLEEGPVASGDLVQGRLLDCGQRLAEGREALALLSSDPQVGQVEEVFGRRNGVEQLERVLHLCAAGKRFLGHAQRDLGDLAELRHPLGERRHRLAGELERPSCGTQPVVDACEHAAKPFGPVGREQPDALGLPGFHVVGERLGEGLRPKHGGLALVEDAEARVEPGLEGMRPQEPVAEAVDRRDPPAVEIAREVVALDLDEPLADPRSQLAGGALGVRDDEDVVDAEPALTDSLDEPLDEHRRLPRAGSGRDEDDARLVDRRDLLIGRRRPHARRTLHIVQREHQRGHSPLRGSVRTSPACTRSTARRARACASSTWCQKSSSER